MCEQECLKIFKSIICFLVGPRGLEPLAFSMSRKRSNQLSYEPEIFICSLIANTFNQRRRGYFLHPFGVPALFAGTELWARNFLLSIDAAFLLTIGTPLAKSLVATFYARLSAIKFSFVPLYYCTRGDVAPKGLLSRKFYGQGGSRTLTTLRSKDFKSFVYAIPPLARHYPATRWIIPLSIQSKGVDRIRTGE